MIWRTEETRQVYVSRDVVIGALYPPVRARRRWRWRCWVNGKHADSIGTADTEAAARLAVETVFKTFLKSAGLQPAESEAE